MAFIRWKVRVSHRGWKKAVNQAAYLVASVRTERGPRQRHVAYLGTISSSDGQSSAWSRKWFWQRVEERLSALSLPVKQVERLRTALERRIPRPSEEDLRYQKKKEEEELASLGSLMSPLFTTKTPSTSLKITGQFFGRETRGS